jgi:dihydroorotate dehydrogenase electron transfer subunit
MITEIVESITETDDIRTITFTYPKTVDPGQFFMIWIPGVDEIPMSVSAINGDRKAITFKKVGDATTALSDLGSGDKIGIRGPYGNGFKLQGKHILFVGGGTGVAMLAPAVEQALDKGISATVIIGVKTKWGVFFDERLRSSGAHVFVSTDDGSVGYKGLASELTRTLISKGRFSAVLTCGPELMMKQVVDLCTDIPLQASLERYMKCAIGLCGQCCIGNGLRVCKDGPIFDGKTLKTVADFGVFRRDSAGRIVRF